MIQKALGLHQTPSTYLWHHFLEGVHDSGALGLLEVGEAAGDDDHGRQHHAQIQLQKRADPEPRGGEDGVIIDLVWVHLKACLSVEKGDLQTLKRF